jgi:hypothetical protein
MSKKKSSSRSGMSSTKISAGKAVFIGHLFVNIPVLILIIGFALGGRIIFPTLWLIFLLVGFILAWLWWSFTVPRWRQWALKRGAPADRLQKLAVSTGLVWPKGSFFEKTEFKVKK